MAEQEQQDEAKPKSKKKLIIIIVLALLLLGGGGGAAYYFLFASKPPAEETAAEPVKPVKARALYVKIRMPGDKPSFVVSLTDSNGRQRFMQLFVEAKTRDQAIVDALNLHMPLICDRLNFIFSSADFTELQTNEGKLALQQKALEAVKEIITKETGKSDVEAILFTNLVMQ
ncbi:flagellar basal body-associated FliL family protein [Pokkaliibacter sp. MBI-7]|uniref:flagellar basal body-associated FliL family protein n=1 Tax=Pokkaliibacter sp. MBI-7 TaxID=3040600 RepID=UPI0024494ABA|nr:flagellar basal body-associated FliL family protein [Pokkaliibacter sp. MBI-7]MDH2431258.1 flagellar basal body-associated FliL family protein [Pokkaliibacter sp. MBI-7]